MTAALPARVACVAPAIGAAGYAVLHVVELAALATCGLRTGGLPLNPLGIAGHALVLAASLWWMVRSLGDRSGQALPDRLVSTVLPVPALAAAAAGAIEVELWLGGAWGGARYRPMLDNDGLFFALLCAVAVWTTLLAVAARWRALFGAGMGGVVLGAVFLPPLAVWILRSLATATLAEQRLPFLLLALAAVSAAAGPPLLGWRPLRHRWRADEWVRQGGRPNRWAASGAGLLLVAGVSTLTSRFLGLGGGAILMAEGQANGWSGVTVPAGAYGIAGRALPELLRLYPWVLAACGLVWLAAATLRCGLWVRAQARRPRPATPAAASVLPVAPAFALAAVLVAVGWWASTPTFMALSPSPGAADVPLDAPLVVRVRPGRGEWGPGVGARYPETSTPVSGGTSHDAAGLSRFYPDGGWRPASTVEVTLCCMAWRRDYRYTFRTADQ